MINSRYRYFFLTLWIGLVIILPNGFCGDMVPPSKGLELEYKLEQKSRPGAPGFVDYYTIWVAEPFLRRDINNEISSIIDPVKNIRLEINHLTRAYESTALTNSKDDIHFVRDRQSVQRVKGQPCDVYKAGGEENGARYEIEIWITKKEAMGQGGSLLELLTSQSLKDAFPGPVPRGIPMKFTVLVFAQGEEKPVQSLSIVLLSQKNVSFEPDHFSVPEGYKKVP